MSDNLIIVIVGFVFLLIVTVLFKDKINKAQKVKFGLTGFEFEASKEEFESLFQQTYNNLLKRQHVVFFCELFVYKNPPELSEVIPGFNRKSEEWRNSTL